MNKQETMAQVNSSNTVSLGGAGVPIHEQGLRLPPTSLSAFHISCLAL